MARKPEGIVHLDTRGTGVPGTFDVLLRESGFCGVFREVGSPKKGMCMEVACKTVDGEPEYVPHGGDHKSPTGDTWVQPDSYIMASADVCTVHPQHVMVNQGRREQLAADLYECACGKQAIANTDEWQARLKK